MYITGHCSYGTTILDRTSSIGDISATKTFNLFRFVWHFQELAVSFFVSQVAIHF